MSARDRYAPGPEDHAHIEKDGARWVLVLRRDLLHPPELVWDAITDPAQLREWAPFDADRNLGSAGAPVRLTTVGAPMLHVTETTIERAEPPTLLVYDWGGEQMRWELEATAEGTRLTLWTSIDRQYIAMGAAGWHLCLDVLAHSLAGEPMGRIVGMEALSFEPWQTLHQRYRERFGVEMS
ncbi:MAG: SRPBCC domain-containing protein [Gemmatimonadaceae bacterium]|nr:SRPBCC domain-containing protein [Gemmatimonadaceae bacterium]MCW5825576.1 SRPBCC domain-containing protein [Gemmatimonadaceae bacterium]